tara:strand:+ start:38 stop:217 length:180 start_codon:yes stop_codon:yes gene_type:complete
MMFFISIVDFSGNAIDKFCIATFFLLGKNVLTNVPMRFAINIPILLGIKERNNENILIA